MQPYEFSTCVPSRINQPFSRCIAHGRYVKLGNAGGTRVCPNLHNHGSSVADGPDDWQARRKAAGRSEGKMMLPEIVSVIAGSVILVGLFTSIAKRPKSIAATGRDWQKIEVAA